MWYQNNEIIIAYRRGRYPAFGLISSCCCFGLDSQPTDYLPSSVLQVSPIARRLCGSVWLLSNSSSWSFHYPREGVQESNAIPHVELFRSYFQIQMKQTVPVRLKYLGVQLSRKRYYFIERSVACWRNNSEHALLHCILQKKSGIKDRLRTAFLPWSIFLYNAYLACFPSMAFLC